MATITPTVEEIKTFQDDAHVITWALLTTTNADGAPIGMTGSADRSVQVEGTFGAAGNVVIEGSNDGVNYRVLTDPQGNALNITSAKIEEIIEIVKLIRPRVTAGDGTTSLTVSMLLRRAFK